MHCTDAAKIERTREVFRTADTANLKRSRAGWGRRMSEDPRPHQIRTCGDILELIDAELATRNVIHLLAPSGRTACGLDEANSFTAASDQERVTCPRCFHRDG
jgi:hypothetical protein